MQKKKIQKNRGYTIIEMMIAISVFLVIITVGMGSLLNTSLIHSRSQNTRSVVDNLSFMMEEMSRNLRTGYNYHCGSFGSGPRDCTGDRILSFTASDSSQWAYVINTGSPSSILRSVNGVSGPYINLLPSDVTIDFNSSPYPFVVTGSGVGDNKQPFVTIRLSGKITDKNGVVTPFSLQTSVSQWLLDREGL